MLLPINALFHCDFCSGVSCLANRRRRHAAYVLSAAYCAPQSTTLPSCTSAMAMYDMLTVGCGIPAQPEIARDFMELHLSAELRAIGDLSTLKLESGSFVEDDLHSISATCFTARNRLKGQDI